jgi:prepilin-type processing-associated H-X9-DG protein
MIASPPSSARSRLRPGLNLVEVLVVLGVVGLLVGLTLPAIQQARAAAERVACQSRLRQIGLALQGHHDTLGAFPPGQDPAFFAQAQGPIEGVSWLAKLLPFVEQQLLWEQTQQAVRQDRAPWHNPPHVGLATVIPLYTCPSDPRVAAPQQGPDGVLAAYTSYKGVRGTISGRDDGVLPLGYTVRVANITDGTSQTIMVGERPPSARLDSGWWYTSHWSAYTHDFILWAEMRGESPYCIPPPPVGRFVFGPGRFSNQCDLYHFWSPHGGGANFSFADASVRYLSYSISPKLRDLASRAGGEAVELP